MFPSFQRHLTVKEFLNNFYEGELEIHYWSSLKTFSVKQQIFHSVQRSVY